MKGCKPDSNADQAGEEEAYLADYEAPSDKWGFIDTLGNIVIDARFDDVASFSEGLAAVNQDGKWGFIDQKGEMVIEPVYKSAWSFHEGKARVELFDGPDAYIDRSGQLVTAEDWHGADDFSDSLAKVKVGNSFGFIDHKGRIIIPPLYARSWNFINSRCVVEYQEKMGVIDKTGDYIIKPEYESIRTDPQNEYFLCNQAGNATIYNHSGERILHFANARAEKTDGSSFTLVRNGKSILMVLADTSQRSAPLDDIIPLEERRWAGKRGSGYVLLDGSGNILTQTLYSQINKFHEGIAACSRGEYWGYINTNGDNLTEEVFGLAWDYQEGFARAAFKDGIAFINKNQELAFYPPSGTVDMRDFSEGFAAIQID